VAFGNEGVERGPSTTSVPVAALNGIGFASLNAGTNMLLSPNPWFKTTDV